MRTTRILPCARRAARLRSWRRSARGSCSRSGGGRGDPPSRAALRPARAGLVEREPEHRDSRQHDDGAVTDRLVRDPSPAAAVALELRRRVAQRSVRDPGAQRLLLRRPVPAPDIRRRRGLVGGVEAECLRGHMGAKARVRTRRLQLLHQRRGVRVHRRGGPPRRRPRLEAPAAVSVRSRERPVAAPQRTACADARRRGHPPGPRVARPRARAPPRRSATHCANHRGGTPVLTSDRPGHQRGV
jgi:hypothetical protein